MLSKGGCVGASTLAQVCRTIVIEANNVLSRTAVIGSTTPGAARGFNTPAADDRYRSVKSLSAEHLAALSSVVQSCRVPKRISLRRPDPLVSAGVRALCSFPTSATTTSTRSSTYNVAATTTTTKSSMLHKPIPATELVPSLQLLVLTGACQAHILEILPDPLLPHARPPQELVPSLQALVLRGARHDPQLNAIADSAIAAMPHLSPQQISDLTVGFAQLGHFCTRFKSRAADEIVSRLAEFPPTALANAAWAFGELQYLDCILLTSILPHVHAYCDQFSATDLAKVLWVYARVGYRDESLPDIMSAMAAKMGADFCPKTLSEVVFATAQLGWAEPEVVEALAGHALDNLPAYDVESLGKLAFGLASCGLDDPEVFEAVGDRAVQALDEMGPVDVARVLWALSQIGHYHKELLAKVTEAHLPANMHLYDRDELKMLVQACNKLGCTTQSVADAAQLLQQREDQLPEEDVGTPVPAASW